MPWLQLRIDCTQAMAEALDQSLSDAGALAVTMEDAGDQPLLEPGPGETPLWSELRVTGLFNADIDQTVVIARLRDKLGSQLPAYRFEILEDKDWEREWMKNYQPIHCGNDLWICPNWFEPPDPGAVNLRLDPGLAFGTGTHPTTRLCLDWLSGHPPRQQNVIDYGCGSGILGIAALLLGAHHCIGVDNDPQALIASRNNARNNKLPDSQFSVYSPQELPDNSTADVVLANILYGPLIELRDTLCQLLSAGGYLVLSGILNEQADPLCHHYQQRLSIVSVDSQEDWSRVVAQKA